MSSSLRIGVAPSESFTIEKDASEGKENGPSTDKVDDKPSKPQKPSKMRTDDDGKPSMENVDLDQFREAAIKAGYEDVANYYAKKTDGNASFLRAARAGNLEKVLEYLKGSTDINTSNANGLNALHLSSKEGHLNIVTELLKRGANVNAATKKGNTALHIGALAGQEEIVKVLIEHGADVNVQSQNGFTPLYMAAQENHTGVVKYLLSHSADQNLATEDGFLPIDVATQQGHDIVVETLLQHSRPQYPQKAEDGFTPLAVALQQGHDKVVAVLLENDRAGKTRLPALHIAARKDDTKAAALLLQSGHNPDVTSKSGFTPLHIAAHYGHVTVATLLLQKGATVDYSARNHITPLHVAAKWGKVNMVNTLLDRGAKIDAKTRDGLTPLHCSARSGHDQCVDQLLERGAPISTKTKSGLAPLHMAAQGDHVDSARLLLFHKAPVDDVTVDYLTPLHVAAHCGHHRVAKLLLDRKATADARALNGFTPLHIACKKNRIKVIELLLKYGASIHATTESGLTPLHAAAFMGNVQIVPYLIKNGAKVNVTNVRGETPLHLAARSNQIDVMKILIDNGATVDACAHENQTPLHIAARLGNAEIVTLLLEKGANADAQTRDQYTALHIAAREGKEDVAAVLLDRGATLSMKTKKDFTPLHVAAKYGRLEVASLLLRNYAAPDAKAQNGLTPLHIAAHYDNVDVAMLLLDHGASPHTAAKNGFTPLHIAAKKNQMDVATTLLEYGAEPNATTKHGISPVHLAALEGHSDMLSLLLERGAKPDIVSKNGLTPLHLAAQEDQLNCAVILVNSKAEIDPKTKAGYTPLHVACHHGNIKTATYLLEHDASVHEKTKHGLTPLHQGAQQGHVGIVNILLAHSADPNEKANNGYTPLAIAKRLGYISVVNTLTIVTEETTVVISPNDEKLKVQVPETMQINFMSDSDDEADGDGDDVSMTGDQLLLSPQEIRTMGDDSITARKSWEDDWMREPNMNYFSGIGSLSGHYSMTSPSGHLSVTSPSGYSTLDSRYGGDRSMNGDVTINGEAPILASSEIMVESSAPMLESTPQRQISGDGDKEGPRSIPSFHGFLISFIVDARGGTMRSKRLPGLRLVVPPKRASGPTRVTCRLIKRTKLQTPPPLVENESLSTRVIEVGPSNTQFLGGLGNKLVTYPPLNDGETMVSRILEMGPATEKFLRPVLLEVPHFASLRGNEREIVVLRSDNGESWREHSLGATEEEVKKTMDGYELEDNNVPSDKRICRIITKDFPQYFAIISRVRQETNIIGTQGGMLNSTVVPQVQAVFPEGTLTKKIKVGLQAQPVSNDAVKKVLGNRVMVSPIVTIEPRRRKFHKPITVTIPVPTAYNQGVNTYGGDTPTLRLLCSISGGTAPAQWEDITGTTPLTFVNDCVSFTTTVSARFWLMDCKEIDQASNFARELYQELKAVPFMSKFVVFAKTHDPIEARVRVFCVTDDKIDKPLEQKEEFKEVARSKDVEVLDGRPVFIELAGNLVPVQKSGEQLHLNFHAFHENRLPFFVRMRDQTQEPCGRLSFMREPRVQRGLPPQVSVCNLNVTMPAYVKVKKATDSESESESESEDEDYKMEKGEREQYHQDILLSNLNFDYIKDKKKYTFPDEASRGPGTGDKPEIILWDVANKMGSDWPALGRELGINNREIKLIENENDDLPEQAFVLLHLWAERQSPAASTSQLADALQAIGRGDIVDQCLPEDKPLDVTVTTSRQAYSPLRGDLDSPKDGTADITIDITGDEEPGFEELKQEITDEKDAGARSPTDDVTVKHAEIEELRSIDSDTGSKYQTKTVTTTIITKKVVSGSEVTPEELENVIQDQAKTEVSEKFVEELKETAVKESIPKDIDEQIEKHVKEQKEYEIPGEKREALPEDINQSVTSRVVSVEQTRTVVTSKRVESSDGSGRPKERDSESESSVDTAIFVDRPQTTTTSEVQIRETLVSDGSPVHRTEFMNNVSNVNYMAPEIQIDEAPTPERFDSEEENEYLPPTEEQVIAASEERKTEGINPDLSMEPESVEDDDIPSPVVESDITLTTESTVQGINPDMQIGPDPLDSPGDLPSPEYQEGSTPTGAQAIGFGMSPEEEQEPTITGRSIPDVAREATVQTITVQTKIETTSPDGEDPITTFKKSEVTVSESALEPDREFVGVAVTTLAEDSTPGDKQEEPQDVEDTGEPSDDKKQPIQQEITTIKTKQKVVHFEEHVYVETGRASLPVDDEDQVIITTDHEQDNVVDDAVTPHEDVIVEHEPEVEKEPEVEEEPAAVDKVTDEPEATAYEVHEDIRDKEDLEDRVEADLEEDRQAEQMSEVEKETKVDDLPEAEQEEVVAPEVGSEPAEDKTEVEETPESREEVVKEITVDETADVHEEPEAEEEIKKDAVVEEQETIEDKLTLEEESKELAEEKVDDDVEDIKVTEVETTILVTSKVEKISEVVLDQEDPQIETDIAPQMKKELLPDGPLVEEQVEEVVEDELQKVDAETSKEEELVEPVDDTPKFMEETPTHEEQLEEKNVIPDIVSESKEAPVSHEEPDEVRNVEEASQDYKQFEIQSSERIVIESSQSFDEREPLSEPVDKDDEESKEETLESSEVQTVETVTVTDKIVVEEKTVTSQGEAPTDMLEDEDVAQKASSEEKTNHDESAENKDLDDVIDTNELKNVETTQESVVSEQITTVHVHAELTEERGMAQEPNTMKDEVDPNNFPKELAEKVEQTEYKEGASTVEEVSKQPEPVVEERAETPEERETKPQDELNMEETAPVTDQSITEDKASTPVEERETIETQEKVILVEELSKEQDDDTKQDKGGSYAVMDEPSMESQPIGEATSVHVYAEKTTLVVHDDRKPETEQPSAIEDEIQVEGSKEEEQHVEFEDELEQPVLVDDVEPEQEQPEKIQQESDIQPKEEEEPVEPQEKREPAQEGSAVTAEEIHKEQLKEELPVEIVADYGDLKEVDDVVVEEEKEESEQEQPDAECHIREVKEDEQPVEPQDEKVSEKDEIKEEGDVIVEEEKRKPEEALPTDKHYTDSQEEELPVEPQSSDTVAEEYEQREPEDLVEDKDETALEERHMAVTEHPAVVTSGEIVLEDEPFKVGNDVEGEELNVSREAEKDDISIEREVDTIEELKDIEAEVDKEEKHDIPQTTTQETVVEVIQTTSTFEDESIPVDQDREREPEEPCPTETVKEDLEPLENDEFDKDVVSVVTIHEERTVVSLHEEVDFEQHPPKEEKPNLEEKKKQEEEEIIGEEQDLVEEDESKDMPSDEQEEVLEETVPEPSQQHLDEEVRPKDEMYEDQSPTKEQEQHQGLPASHEVDVKSDTEEECQDEFPQEPDITRDDDGREEDFQIEEQVPEDTYEQTRYFEELQNIPEEPEEETSDTQEESSSVVRSETVRTVVTTKQVISSGGIVDEHTEVKVFKDEELIDKTEDFGEPSGETLQGDNFEEEVTPKHDDDASPIMQVEEQFKMSEMPSDETHPEADEAIQSKEVERMEESVPVEEEIEIEMEAVEENIKTEMTPDEEIDVFAQDDTSKDYETIPSSSDHYTQKTEVRVHTEITTSGGTLVHEERKVVEDGEVKVDFKMDTLKADDGASQELLQDEEKQEAQPVGQGEVLSGPEWNVDDEEDNMEDEEDVSSEEGEYMPEIRVDPTSEYVQPKDDTEIDEDGLMVEPDPFTEESDVSMDEREEFAEEEEQRPDGVHVTSKISVTSTQIADGTIVSHTETTRTLHTEQQITSGEQPTDDSGPSEEQDEPEIIHDELLEQSIILESQVCLDSEPKDLTDRPKTPEIADITEHEEFSTYFQDQDHQQPVSDIHVPDADVEVEVPEISPEDDVEMDLPEPPVHPYVDDGEEGVSHERYVYSSTTVVAPNVQHVRSDADWTVTEQTTRVVTKVEERISVPTDLNLDQSPSPQVESVQTPEIQELPDTPDSIPESPLAGIYESERDQPVVGGADEVAAAESEPHENLTEEVPEEQDGTTEPDDAVYVDGPTESDYYDPRLLAQPAASVVADLPQEQEQRDEPTHEQPQDESLEERVSDDVEPQGEQANADVPETDEQRREEDQRLMAEAITIGVLSAVQSTDYQRDDAEQSTSEELQSTEVFSTEASAQEEDNTADIELGDGDSASAVEFQGSPEDEDKEATDTQEGVDSIEDERTERRDSSGDLASGEQTSMTTITTTRTVYRSSAVTSEGQVLDGDELVDSIVKPKSAVEFQGSPEDEDKEATDTQEGVDSIEDERTERIDSSGDLASGEQTSMTTITTTRTVYGSSAVTSEVQVLDGDELVDSIVKPKSAVEFQGSPEDEDKEATDTQEGVDSIEDERTEGRDSSGDLASGEQTSMTTITTTRTVYGSSAVTSEGQVLDGDELVDSIVKPKSAVEFQGSPEDEDKEATDTQEGVDSIEDERTERIDSSGDLASREQTSMTTITTTRTVYGSSAVTSEGQVLDGDELVDSIVKPKSAVEFQGSPEDEDKEATDTQEGVDSIEDERTERIDSSGDLASGEQTSMTTITTTRTVYGSSAVTSEGQVLDGDELVDSIVKPKSAVEFQGSPEDEDKEATDTQEGVDSIENERTEERDSSGDLASGEQTSMTTITTTRTVYRSSAVTSEGQVLDGDELVDSIVKPKSAVEFQGSPEDEDKEATDTQEGVDSIEDERTEGRDSSGDLASGEQTSMTTITTTRTVYGSSAVTSEVQVLDGDELVDSIVKPKAPEEVETADADIKTPQEEEEGKVPDILKKTEESEAMDEGDDHDDVDSPTKPVAVPLGHEGGTTTIVHHTYVVTREQRAMTEPTVSEAFISERQGTEPPVDESFDVSFRKSPDEESRPKMDPAAVQEMADLLNEVGEGEPAADEPGEDEPTGPGVEEDDQRLAEHAPPPQQEATKVKLSPQDEEELQHLWAMDWPEPGEKPISSDPAEKVESAPPGPREESAPPSQTRTTTTFVESAPRPESSLQDQSAPPAPDAGSGSLLINFNPGEHASTGFKMTPDREKELQELWQEDTRDGDEQRRQPEEEDDGPKVQENMAPKGLPPASSQRKFELTEDDQKQLQNFWDEPPVAQVEPQQQQSAPPQQHSAPPPDGFSTVPGDMPFGDDDVTEEVEVEEFEEELPDGTIRKVIRKRIKRSTVQMVPIDMDPADLPPGGSHNIVVHKKVTKNTVVRDGEEVETSENVDTEIEQDGIVTDAADLRDDLQQLVDQFLEDGTVDGAQVILDEREVVDESDI
ncbi:uncharacterized protein [Apostichopus japonicus]|uniref:uncharacterized protein isoform X10 n=1 Tax=Stichopus japonicus TaxID=307972 RepID=UPI003AB5CE25